MYKVTLLPDAEKSFKKLDRPIQLRIAEKIDWLSKNAEKIIHRLVYKRRRWLWQSGSLTYS